MKSLIVKFFSKHVTPSFTASDLAVIRSNAAMMVRELQEGGDTYGTDYNHYLWQVHATDEELLAVMNY